MKNITAHIVLYNCNRILYPWREAIASVLPVVDEVIAVDCGSNDGTSEEIDRLAASAPIRILTGHWGDKSEILSEMTNLAISQVKTDYHFQIQADEVLHEDSCQAVIAMPKMGFVEAATFRFTHLVGDFQTTFSFMYTRAIRFARTASPWRSVGDAAQFDVNRSRKDTYPSNARIMHYGKVHVGRRHEASVKEFTFQQMFVHLGLGFPDPLVVAAQAKGVIDYDELFHVAKERGDFKPLTISHPAIMRGWIEAMNEREQNQRDRH